MSFLNNIKYKIAMKIDYFNETLIIQGFDYHCF